MQIKLSLCQVSSKPKCTTIWSNVYNCSIDAVAPSLTNHSLCSRTVCLSSRTGLNQRFPSTLSKSPTFSLCRCLSYLRSRTLITWPSRFPRISSVTWRDYVTRITTLAILPFRCARATSTRPSRSSSSSLSMRCWLKWSMVSAPRPNCEWIKLMQLRATGEAEPTAKLKRRSTARIWRGSSS